MKSSLILTANVGTNFVREVPTLATELSVRVERYFGTGDYTIAEDHDVLNTDSPYNCSYLLSLSTIVHD